jgi:DNA polymerase-3 subunit beta
MKITCTQENLNQGLSIVSHIASKNASLPILNNVLIQVDNNNIKLSTTNLEMGITCLVRGKIENKGAFTVQSKLITDYVSLLPKEKVNLEVIDEKEGSTESGILNITCKNYTTKIKGMSSSDFPLIPQIEKNNPYICKINDLKSAISQTIFAVSLNETRPEIGGVLMSFNQNKLTLAATDSYRLAEKVVDLKSKFNIDEQRVIVPARTLQELLRILSSLKDPTAIEDIDNIEIYVVENQILFVLGNIELISRLIEGQYPDYKQIIPQNYETEVLITNSEFIKAVKTASLFTRSGIYDINLEIIPNSKELVISSTNSQLGENVSRLASKINGKTNNILVNFRYLLDGLQNIDVEEIELKVVDSNSPCAIKPKGKDDYLYIVMPIKQ